jgi:radical SAM protein with 4Fe4S-binding SPASM domain
MAAKYKSRAKRENYEPLHERIPLSAPYSILVDVSSLCNFKCFFCPMCSDKNAQTSKRIPGVMDFELFKKIIDDIAEFGMPIKMLELGMHGEPFTNPRLAEMVAYAKGKAYFQRVSLVTNGSLLTPERAIPVIEAGLDQLDISVNGTSDNHFYQVTGTKVNFEEYVRNITYLFEHRQGCVITTKAMSECLKEDQKQIFLETFSPICDQIFLEHLVPYWPDHDIEWPEVQHTMLDEEVFKSSEVCPFVFYKMRITSDGKAILCSADWEHRMVLGDLREQSVKAIWESDTLFQYQVTILRGERRKIPFCSECEMFRYTQLVHLDPYREEILKRVLEHRQCE